MSVCALSSDNHRASGDTGMRLDHGLNFSQFYSEASYLDLTVSAADELNVSFWEEAD